MINNDKPKIFIWWHEETPTMTNSRLECLNSFNNCKEHWNLCLITPGNLNSYILKEDPLNKSFKYLSPVHKSDFICNYMSYHYGGCVFGIKNTRNFTKLYSYWKNFMTNDNCYYMGAKLSPSYIAHNPQLTIYKKCNEEVNNLFDVRYWFSKKHNPMSKKILDKMYNILDEKYIQLSDEKNKWLHSRDHYNCQWKNDKKYYYSKKRYKFNNIISSYPLRWAELGGEIVHEVSLEYLSNINNTLPDNFQIRGSHNWKKECEDVIISEVDD